ncbi:lytic transglycosylase domain-containing protein [Mesorhizobium sp. ES1-1]|uniref:lytic transglycosylase domain-containing protein n=1 Tax=Mesorhizobium sp. ES1-1 TaxID=2876629 RepID=UPI001CCF8B62|nr:transglycosylase SLT domain-containing protein [Mesorhizobium sp. ES1-1]MBZ9675860.1 transglycosylase SLT domain-containing protein [Mesorhizobium sp. ES1-1]
MHKLTVVTAALAAGVFSVAFSTAHSAPLSPRADQGLSSPSAKTSPAKVTKRAPAKVEKASLTHAKTLKAKKRSRRAHMAVDTMTTASIGARPVALPTAPAGDGQYSAIVARYAATYGVPVSLAHAVIRIESNYRPNMVGSAGEIGLMQIKPATARMMGYSGADKGLFDPDTNIKYGMKYLAMAQDLGGGTTCGTILKYNAGHAATRMNPVSAAYCSKVKVQMAAL